MGPREVLTFKIENKSSLEEAQAPNILRVWVRVFYQA